MIHIRSDYVYIVHFAHIFLYLQYSCVCSEHKTDKTKLSVHNFDSYTHIHQQNSLKRKFTLQLFQLLKIKLPNSDGKEYAAKKQQQSVKIHYFNSLILFEFFLLNEEEKTEIFCHLNWNCLRKSEHNLPKMNMFRKLNSLMSSTIVKSIQWKQMSKARIGNCLLHIARRKQKIIRRFAEKPHQILPACCQGVMAFRYSFGSICKAASVRRDEITQSVWINKYPPNIRITVVKEIDFSISHILS